MGRARGRWIGRIGVVCVLFGAAVVPAAAEPIEVTYRIDISRRCEFLFNEETCTPYSASFPLTLTFEATPTQTRGDDLDRLQFYGTPTVSDVPLPLRTDFPPLQETIRGTSERAQYFADMDAWYRFSHVQIRSQASVNGSDYYRSFSLLAEDYLPAPPELNAVSFTQFLASAPFRQFYLADAVELNTGGFELLAYYGTISFEGDAAATPEPASLLLLGTGLAAIGMRRRRR